MRRALEDVGIGFEMGRKLDFLRSSRLPNLTVVVTIRTAFKL